MKLLEPAPSYVCLPLQTQAIQTEPIVAAHPAHHAQLEELLLPRSSPAANVPLVGAEHLAEAFAAAIAAATTGRLDGVVVVVVLDGDAGGAGGVAGRRDGM